MDRVFAFVSRTDFFLLSQIQLASAESSRADGIYLSELAEFWNISITDASRIAKRLEEKGWIIWTFNEDKTCTWLRLSEVAIENGKQEEAMLNAQERIAAVIPEEDLQTTIKTMQAIQELIESHEVFM